MANFSFRRPTDGRHQAFGLELGSAYRVRTNRGRVGLARDGDGQQVAVIEPTRTSHVGKHAKGEPPREFRFRYGGGLPLETEAQIIANWGEALTASNEVLIALDPEAYPCCLNCGKLRYIDPPVCRTSRGTPVHGCQPVRTIDEVIRLGYGTCFDLAPMLAAIKRQKGGDSSARINVELTGDPKIPFHMNVIDGTGAVHDAQQILQGGHGGCDCPDDKGLA